MKYQTVCRGTFLSRPNRFVALVEMEGQRQAVHVKNTGRCRELLVPGAEVWLAGSDNPGRKTKYDLIAVRKRGAFGRDPHDPGVLFNIDSQAPNIVVAEWLAGKGFDRVVPEYRYGQSRIDFYMERESRRFLLEVKGCTLERDGIGYFPDAPTQRGTGICGSSPRLPDRGITPPWPSSCRPTG